MPETGLIKMSEKCKCAVDGHEKLDEVRGIYKRVTRRNLKHVTF